jgi:hypothetical protein
LLINEPISTVKKSQNPLAAHLVDRLSILTLAESVRRNIKTKDVSITHFLAFTNQTTTHSNRAKPKKRAQRAADSYLSSSG